MIGFLMFGSLVLGLIAWIFPIINLIRFNKSDNRKWLVLSILSISACAIALCLQIFYNYHLVKIEDWSALLDTTGAVSFVSAVLLVVTIILNSIVLIIYRDRMAK